MAEISHRLRDNIWEREREERATATAITNRKWEKNKRKFGEKWGSAYNNNAHKSINKCCHHYIPNPRYPILLFFYLFIYLLLFIYLFIFIFIFILMIKVLNTSVLS
jgi:hypothetical protein